MTLPPDWNTNPTPITQSRGKTIRLPLPRRRGTLKSLVRSMIRRGVKT
jgi:hypothetical protein